MAVALVVSLFIATFLIVQTVRAVSGTCYFNTTAGPVTGTGSCSVPGYGNYGTNDILPGRTSASSPYRIPNSVNTKAEFINFVVGRYNSGNTQATIGAAFIMQGMRGSRAWCDNSCRNDWVSRMQNPNVTLSFHTYRPCRSSWYDPGKRNVFFANYCTSTDRHIIRINYKGNRVVDIERECGNLVAEPSRTIPPTWNTNPSTTMFVDGTQRNRDNTSPYPVNVGDRVRWEHEITNHGPGSTDEPISWQILNSGQNTYVPEGSDTWASGRPNGATLTRARPSGGGNLTIPDSAAGRLLCQRFWIDKNTSWDYSNQISAWRCVQVQDAWSITATLSSGAGEVVPETFVERPDFPVVGDVADTAANRSDISSGNHPWRVVAYRYEPGVGVPSNLGVRPNDSNDPCNVPALRAAASDCRNANTISDVYDGTPNPLEVSRHFNAFGYGDPDYPLGTTFCFMLSVRDPTHRTNDNTNWYHSALRCSTAAKEPKFQVHGGDVRVNGSGTCSDPGSTGHIQTSLTRMGGAHYGSWGEFGAISRCGNDNFASGTGLRTGGTAQQQDWSRLTLANTPVFGEFSNSVSTGASAFASCSDIPDLPNSRIHSTFDELPSPGNVTGVHCIESGEVVIDSDVILSNSPGSLGGIPQVIIIANTIKIRDNVGRVDAWLVARTNGNLYTCVNGSDNRFGQLSSSRCSGQLVINGPVVTGKLFADRTYGADISATPATNRHPAEVFNLPASSSLWYYQQIRGSALVDTMSVKELPPRY